MALCADLTGATTKQTRKDDMIAWPLSGCHPGVGYEDPKAVHLQDSGRMPWLIPESSVWINAPEGMLRLKLSKRI